jgi:hypothetical protein
MLDIIAFVVDNAVEEGGEGLFFCLVREKGGTQDCILPLTAFSHSR